MGTMTRTDSIIGRVEQYLSTHGNIRHRNNITLEEYFKAVAVDVGSNVGAESAYRIFEGPQMEGSYTSFFGEDDVKYLHERFFGTDSKPKDKTITAFYDGVNGEKFSFWRFKAQYSALGIDQYPGPVGLRYYYHFLVENSKPISKELAELMVFSLAEAKKQPGFPATGGGGGPFGVNINQLDGILKKLFEEHPDILSRNVANFEEYYGFKKWDQEIVKYINSELDKDSDPLRKSMLGAGVLIGTRYHYVKNRNVDIGSQYSISNNRIHLISTIMWWDSSGWTNTAGVGAGPAVDRFVGFAEGKVLDLQPDRALTSRYDDTSGFSDLSVDEMTLDTGLFQAILGTVRSSQEWFGAEFGLKFLELVTYDDAIGSDGREIGYTYTSGAADTLMKDEIKRFLKQKVEFDTIKERGLFSTGNIGNSYVTMDITLFQVTAAILMNAFRESWWKSRAAIINSFDDTADEADVIAALEEAEEEDFAEAEEEAEVAADEITVPPDEEEEEYDRLSEAERRRRELVLKQCALMVNLPELSSRHRKEIVTGGRPIHKIGGNHATYKNRFYMVQDGNDEGDTVNKLLIPPFSSVSDFVDMKPEVHAHLVPKIRLFRVDRSDSGELIQKEFIFPKQMNSARVNNLSKVRYDRGGEFGIKEFSFSFNGTNPATARNDIEAKLSLYFQSFKDFVERRGDMAFVDLIIHPKPDMGESINAAHPDFYSAKNYRIKVDVGWELSSIQELNYPAPRVKSLRDALQKTNKSFYLNRIDETIDFRDDGSVQIDIEYRAYAETATKGTALDALSTYESRRARKEVRDDYLKVANRANCSPEQLARIQSQLEQMEALIKQQSYQSIYKRLLCNGSMNFARMDRAAADRSFRVGRFDRAVKLEFPDFANEDLSQISREYEEIPYFYLGDLLYVVLDSIYEEVANTVYIDGTEKFKFILSSFKYEDPFKPGQARVINIGSIPISNELFKEWFTDNVLKSERTSYPIMYFIRDLCKYLITEILTENCFKKSLDKKFEFKTMTFSGLGNDSKGCRMAEMYNAPHTENSVVAKLDDYYKEGHLPLLTDDGGGNNINDLYHYILIFANGPKIILKDRDYKKGNKIKDGAIGLYHYQIGRDRGLVKKMKFSKTDIAFLREARYFNNGFDGLMQLANVYKVSLEMIGNTLYYPGMEIYIDPVGFMGGDSSDFNPSLVGSIANKLGFGGYHIIEKVNSSIAPGKFTTSIDALFVYAGDGNPQSRYVGSQEKITSITEDQNARSGRTNCTNIVDHVETNALEIADGRTNQYSRITDAMITRASGGAAASAGASTTREEEEE